MVSQSRDASPGLSVTRSLSPLPQGLAFGQFTAAANPDHRWYCVAAYNGRQGSFVARFVRFGPRGEERPGLLADDGGLIDLAGHCDDITPDLLAPATLARLAATAGRVSAVDLEGVRLGPPLAAVPKIICVGPNYHAMTRESGTPVPDVPRIYMKAATAIAGPTDAVPLPAWARTAHWEAELAVVIGSTARDVSERAALGHVAGYAILDDIADRETAAAGGGESVKGRSHDGFGPLGPVLVTADEVGDPHRLRIRTTVNGRGFQDGSTADMVFGVAELVAYISRYMTLLPGDIISTGTPGGVGLATDPPTYLKPGDVIEVEIDGLGRQRNEIVAA